MNILKVKNMFSFQIPTDKHLEKVKWSITNSISRWRRINLEWVRWNLSIWFNSSQFNSENLKYQKKISLKWFQMEKWIQLNYFRMWKKLLKNSKLLKSSTKFFVWFWLSKTNSTWTGLSFIIVLIVGLSQLYNTSLIS